MRILLQTGYVITLLIFNLVIAHAADLDSFRNMKWGANLDELQKNKKLTLVKENGADGSSLYSMDNEKLLFGSGALTAIHCSFAQKRLQGVILLFQGSKNFTAIKAEAAKQFGKGTTYTQKDEEMLNWTGEKTNTVLSYNRKTQAGFIFMKAKRLPAATKTQEPKKSKEQIEKENLDAFDKASESAPIPDKPVSRPEPAPPATYPDGITPEIQSLIDRNQALTRLCWGTVGPTAERACSQMHDSVDQLKAMGMCMYPADQGQELVWTPCRPQATAPMPSQATPKEELCQRISDMFMTTAELRDHDTPPQAAERELAWYDAPSTPEITPDVIRDTVAMVYYDARYAGSWGETLRSQVYDACMSGRGPYAYPLGDMPR